MMRPTDLFGDSPEICIVEKDPVKSGLEGMEDDIYKKYQEKHYRLIKVIEDIGLPSPGQQYRLITRRTFNAIQFLEFITRYEKIIELKIAIYSINFEAAKILMNLIQCGLIGDTEILMSNLRNKAHREKEEIIKEMFSTHPRVKLFFCSSHAKIFACRTKKGNFYCVEGSGNLAFNSRVEQYVIDNDQKLFEFTCEWMAEIKKFIEGKKEYELATSSALASGGR